MNPEKVKKIFTNQYFILTALTLIAALIRLLNIDKPYGLWYDEMLTYIFSSKSFPMGILKTLWREDFHMPLYYFYVHIWMKLFGTGDIALRCSSVIWGALSIPAFFYLGKTYTSKKLGYFLAVIACISPIMIYYSQEVRFYSMLLFFAAISLIFFLKLIDNPQKKDYFFFFFANFIILYIYTMGILFVGTEILILFVHFYLYNKKSFSKLFNYSFVFFLLSIPYLYLLQSYLIASKNSLVGAFAWGSKLNIYTPICLFNDWMSPFPGSIYGQNDAFYKSFFQSLSKFSELISISATTIIFIIGFIKNLTKFNKRLLYLILITFLILFTEIILCIRGQFTLTSRYTLIMLPMVLLISSDGLLKLENKLLKFAFISLLFIIFIFNTINYRIMPAFSNRTGGIKFPAKELKKLNLTPNDYILYSNRSELLKKYIPQVHYIDFNIPGILYLDKGKDEALKMFNKDFINTTNQTNAIEKFLPYLTNPNPPKRLKDFMNSSIEKMPKNSRIIIVEGLDWGYTINSNLINDYIKQYKKGKLSKNDFREILFPFVYTKINIDIKNILDKNTSIEKIKNIKLKNKKATVKWYFYVYKKV